MRSIFLKSSLILVGLMFFSLAFAQSDASFGNPRENERVIGTVSNEFITRNTYSSEGGYARLWEKAIRQFPNRNIALRNYWTTSRSGNSQVRTARAPGWFEAIHNSSAQVVEIIPPPPPQQHIVEELRNTINRVRVDEEIVPPPPAPLTREQAFANAMSRALMNVNEGARVALMQVQVPANVDRDVVRDFFVDMLIDRGYRVIARAQLERLLEEQELQHGGGFNERTIARTDNLSAVGFFLDVRVTENSVRVRAINVSTGEYVGNATVEF